MAIEAKLNAEGIRIAYREAVQLCLMEFYEQSERQAKELTAAWWERLSVHRAFRSGLFLHDEPIVTASGLLGVKTVSIAENDKSIAADNWTIYQGLLHQATILASFASEMNAQHGGNVPSGNQSFASANTSKRQAVSRDSGRRRKQPVVA